MPLTDEQKSAIATLKDVGKADAKEFADALNTENHDLYHHIHRAGFSEAEGRYKPQVTAAESAKTAAEEAKAEAEKQLREAQEKAPEVAKVNEQWQGRLDKLKADHATALEVEKNGRKQEREQRKVSDLKAALSGLDPIYIDTIAQQHAGRIRYDEDGTAKLYDGEIPVQLPSGKTPFGALAEELKKVADPRWVLSNADSGSGTGGGGGGGGQKAPGVDAALERNKAAAEAPNALRPAVAKTA